MTSLLKTRSYVLAVIERGRIADVVRSAREIAEVSAGALLIGRYDLLLMVDHYDRADLYKCVSQVRNMPGIRGTSTHIPFEGFTKNYEVQENNALAISLLRTQGSPQTVLSLLRNLDHIVEAHIIPGDWDLLAVLHSNRVEQILDTAVIQFEGVHGITKTETLIAHQYFRKTPEATTVQVGTYVPQYAIDRMKNKITYDPE